MKADERSIQAMAMQLQNEAADNRRLREKLRESDRRHEDDQSAIKALTQQLSEKMSQVSDMMQKMVDFFMGKGDVTLSDSMRDAVISGVRAEFEAREKALKEQYAKELEKLRIGYETRLAAKQNEIDRLRNDDGGSGNVAPSTSMPKGGVDSTMSTEANLKATAQQKANLQVEAYGQHTESEKYRHSDQQTEDADTLDLLGEDVPDEKFEKIVNDVRERKSMKGVKKPRHGQPLFATLEKGSKDDIEIWPDNMPADAKVIGEDVSWRVSCVKGYLRVQRIRRKKCKDSNGKYYFANLPEKYKNSMGRMQITESVVAFILTLHFQYNVTIPDIEEILRKKGLNYAHSTVVGWIEKAAKMLEPLDGPLHKEITSSGYIHSDETTLKCKDKRLPGKNEKEDDVEDVKHFYKRWIFCLYAAVPGLTQFSFFKRGRRTREAIQAYLGEVMNKTYLQCDGAILYKCYDIGELILRVSCLVHMRRPIYHLKDVSEDAKNIIKIFEDIFHKDKLIKEKFRSPDDIKRERLIQLAPPLNELKNYLDRLAKNLEKEEEPELFKAVNYALTEYPCILRCLEDGRLDLSNNVCERKIRRIAKYRNNSFFVGGVKAGERFARLMSTFANIKQHNLDPMEYLCDVFRRIKNTPKENLVSLLPHKWQPVAAITPIK